MDATDEQWHSAASVQHDALLNVRDEDVNPIDPQMKGLPAVDLRRFLHKFQSPLKLTVDVPQAYTDPATDGKKPLLPNGVQEGLLLPPPVRESVSVTRFEIKDALDCLALFHFRLPRSRPLLQRGDEVFEARDRLAQFDLLGPLLLDHRGRGLADEALVGEFCLHAGEETLGLLQLA